MTVTCKVKSTLDAGMIRPSRGIDSGVPQYSLYALFRALNLTSVPLDCHDRIAMLFFVCGEQVMLVSSKQITSREFPRNSDVVVAYFFFVKL